LLLLAGSIALAQKDDAHARAIAQLRAAVECDRMPHSLNPYGDKCSTEVGKRWSRCTQTNVAERLDCLGFKRPPPPSTMELIKLAAMQKFLVGECAQLPPMMNSMGERCPTEVAERFQRCGPLSVAKQISVEATANCVGFDVPPMPPPPRVLVSCERPKIRAHLLVSAGGKVVLDQHDMDRLQLFSDGTAKVELSAEAGKRFGEVTAAHVGEKLHVEFADDISDPVLETAIPGGKAVFRVRDARPADVCAQ
jgi:hypothetical protein